MNSLITTSNDLQVLQTIAKTAHSSGLYNGVGGAEKILMILLAANDLGIKPTIALNGGIWNIQGKIEISARLMTSMIRRVGHSISIKECSDKVCILKGKRADNGDEAEVSFSWDDATKAGLSGRDVWKKYAQDMLYARAMSRLARRLFPDVIGTAYVEGEIRDGDIIDVTPQPALAEEPKPEDNLKPKKEKKGDYINEEQIKEIIDKTKKCSSAYVLKLNEHLATLGINAYCYIPATMFEMVMKGIEKNIKINSENEDV